MKLTELECVLLYGWGCSDYEGTLNRLEDLQDQTEMEDMVKVIDSLRSKLINSCTWTSYPLLYARATYRSWLCFPELTVSSYRKSGNIRDTFR